MDQLHLLAALTGVSTSDVLSAMKFADINATSDGDNQLVAAVAGKRILVTRYLVTATGAGTLVWKSASTAIGHLRCSGDGTGATTEAALLTNVGEALVINTPAGVDALGHLTYFEVG